MAKLPFKNLCRYFIYATKLPVDDINYNISSDKLNLRSFGKESLPRKGIFIRLASFGKNFIKSTSTIFSKKASSNSSLFFVNNKNELLALEPIYSKLSDSDVAGYGLFYNKCPYFITYLISILFIPLVLYKFLVADTLNKEKYKYAFDAYILSYGFYITCMLWFNKIKPKSIVISNDLIFTNRVIILVAKKLKITTYYIQHASVNNKLPPLTVDYALLDGQDAADKYCECGPSTTVIFIIGIPKLDSFYNKTCKNIVLSKLGICTNDLDSFKRIEKLCWTIKNTFSSLEVYLRSHPSDRRIDDLKKLASRLNINFSDPRNELAFDFLQSVDAIIGCDSNILLEAVLLDVYPMYFDFSKRNLDWYGFVKSGLVEYYTECNLLCEKLIELQKNKPSIRAKAKYYSGTVDTNYDGQSSDLAAMLIENINATVTLGTKWSRKLESPLTIYELKQ